MDSSFLPKTPDPFAAAILLWAAFALVPLGMRLCDDMNRGKFMRRLLTTAGWLQWPAAALLAASFAFEQSMLAALLALPWFAVTLLVAAAGGLDLRRYGWRLDSRTALIAAQLYLPVGGGWAVISRAGLRPQDFSHEIVLLTAVHFHYAGFVLPVLAGLASGGQQLGSRVPLFVDRIVLAAIIAGVPLVGVGISLSPYIEVAAAMLLSVGCVLLAVRQFQSAIATRTPTTVALLGISSLALLSAMGLAAVYAAGEFSGQQLLSIPTMIRSHGLANAIGFATCGLAGWSLPPSLSDGDRRTTFTPRPRHPAKP